ncbi:hypothetical protein QQM79_16075 [Marinobacteraceae bacterium S3BR75-40.1]
MALNPKKEMQYCVALPDKPRKATMAPGIAATQSSSTPLTQNLTLSAQGRALLKRLEGVRLKPYDDQTGLEITQWAAGATIGVGHLIARSN